MVGLKMKLLQPDQEEIMANMKRFQQQGVRLHNAIIFDCRTVRLQRLKEVKSNT